MQPATDPWPDRPVFDGVFGATANPLRLIYMIGAVWRLSQMRPAGVQILEVGSWCGASALAWGEAIDLYFGGKGKITCVDAWQPYVDLEANSGRADRDMDAALVRGEAFEVFRHNIGFLPAGIDVEIRNGWSGEILPALQPDAYDLVYIDADHTYDAVKSDIENGTRLVRPGGIICGDDLERQAGSLDLSILNDRPSLDKYYDADLDVVYHPGVSKAVDEFFGPVSAWSGFWAMQKTPDGWMPLSLEGMAPHIPRHLHPQSLMGLKALLMQEGIL
jgi:predicted O-methyltransferase YrrM